MKTTHVDRLLAVSDWHTAKAVNENRGKARHNSQLEERVREVWLDCSTLQEFRTRCHLSGTKARELDNRFSKLSPHRLLGGKAKIDYNSNAYFEDIAGNLDDIMEYL